MTFHRKSCLTLVGLLFALGLSAPVSAQSAPSEAPTKAEVAQHPGYEIGVRIITAKTKGKFKVDKALKPLSKDLRALPFKRYRQADMHKKVLKSAEQVSLQYPSGKGAPQLLSIQAHGKQTNGKLGFTLSIKDLDFKTRVALPDGGTILVAGPKHKKETVLFSVTAREYSGEPTVAVPVKTNVSKPKKKRTKSRKKSSRKRAKKPKSN